MSGSEETLVFTRAPTVRIHQRGFGKLGMPSWHFKFARPAAARDAMWSRFVTASGRNDLNSSQTVTSSKGKCLRSKFVLPSFRNHCLGPI